MRHIEARVSALEAAVMPLADIPENWTDFELIEKLRAMVMADPGRDWESKLGTAADGYTIQGILVEARTAEEAR